MTAIDSDMCSLSYVSVDDAARLIMAHGPGAALAKIDIKSAYQIVLMHPEDRHLLGMKWEGSLYVDTCLPFGLRSAPKIFTAMADAVEWIVKQKGVHDVIYYLDDYLLVSDPWQDTPG